MTPITIALDWTPNPIHAGFYVAQANNWFAEAGLDVTFLSPEDDDYKKMPADKVADGEAMFGICPSEFVIKSHYLGGGGKLVAVAAILQSSASAFVTLQDSGISRPRQLDDHKYAFLGLPFEQIVLSQMIYMDGGLGVTNNIATQPLQTWQQVLQGGAHCTWIFKPVEGVEAEHEGLKINLFDPHEYGIPYGYAPVLVANKTVLDEQPEAVAKFMKAVARGYHFAAENPDAAAGLLLKTAQFATQPNKDLLLKTQKTTSTYYLTKEGHWGAMTAERWQGFIEWIEEQRALVISQNMPSHLRGTLQETVFTNKFVEPDKITEV